MLKDEKKIKLPLETLIIKLQNQGFNIGVNTRLQIIKILQQFGNLYFVNLKELKQILSPIIVKNKAQQNKFNQIFDEYYNEISKKVVTEQQPEKTSFKKKQNKKHFITSLIIIFLFVTTFFIFKYNNWYPFNETQTLDTTQINYTVVGNADTTKIVTDTNNTIKIDTAKKEIPISILRAYNALNKLQIKYPITDPEKATYNFKWWVKFAVFLFFVLLWLILEFTLYQIRKYRKYGFRKKALEKKFQVNENPPFTIEFPSQNNNITTQENIFELANALRKRRISDIKKIDIKQTILKTIQSGGLSEIIYKKSTKQAEYLILIEQDKNNKQQYELSQYLIDILKNEDINIEKFNYYKDPRRCTNKEYPEGVSLQKLANKYPEHDLIIFGKTKQFISAKTRELTSWAKNDFNNWKQKTIITPKEQESWGYEEHKINKLFAVLPNDINSLFQLVDNKIDTITSSHRINPNKDLNIWISSLAVLEKIDWKITLAIGKELEKNKIVSNRILTYDNLLQIVKTPFLQEENFTQEKQEELLTELKKYPKAEQIARNTVLKLYKRIKVNEISFANTEKQIQTTLQNAKLHPNNKKAQQEYNILNANGFTNDKTDRHLYFSKSRKIIITSLIAILGIIGIITDIYLISKNSEFTNIIITTISLIALILGFGYNFATIKKQRYLKSLLIGNYIFIFWLFIIYISIFSGTYYSATFILAFTTLILTFEVIGNILNTYFENNNKKPRYSILRSIALFILVMSLFIKTNNFDYNNNNFHKLSLNSLEDTNLSYLDKKQIENNLKAYEPVYFELGTYQYEHIINIEIINKIKSAINNLKNNKNVIIEMKIIGNSDRSNMSGIRYKGTFGVINTEYSVISENNKTTKTQINLKPGELIKNNETLAFLRAYSIYFELDKDFKSTNFEYSFYSKAHNEVGQEYIKADISYTANTEISYNSKGVKLYNNNKTDSAIINYNKSISIDTNYFSPHYNLAIIDYNKGVESFNKYSFETAISYFKKVKNDSLKIEKNKNIELCNFKLNRLDSLRKKEIADSLENMRLHKIALADSLAKNQYVDSIQNAHKIAYKLDSLKKVFPSINFFGKFVNVNGSVNFNRLLNNLKEQTVELAKINNTVITLNNRFEGNLTKIETDTIYSYIYQGFKISEYSEILIKAFREFVNEQTLKELIIIKTTQKNMIYEITNVKNKIDLRLLEISNQDDLQQKENITWKNEKYGYFTDIRDNHKYKIVKIEEQIWMAENFAYTPSNGNFGAYDNNKDNIIKYGYLYDWETANKIAPNGWHLPSIQEFETLLYNYGGESNQAYKSLINGGSSGFSSIFAGYMDATGFFKGIDSYAVFWSSSKLYQTNAFTISLLLSTKKSYKKDEYKTSALSVRYIKDN